MPDEMDEIIDDFVTETEEMLEALDEKFVELESRGDDPELINEIFRSVHTMKGAAGFLGYQQIVDVSHRAETLLKKIRDGEMQFTQEITDVVLKALDMLKTLMGHVKARDPGRENIDLLLRVLENAAEPFSEAAATETVEAAPEEPQPIGRMLVEGGVITKESLDDALEEQQRDRKVGEILVEQKALTPTVLEQTLAAQKPAASPEREVTHNIRVDVKRLDAVMNLVGEMVLGRNRLTNIGLDLESHYPEDPSVQTLQENLSFISLVTSDLQLAVMKTRMQPVRKVFSKFPRIVRDMSRKLGKQVDLRVYGEDTELDKSVIEELGDPLVHLIRNAVDHGIEMPDERVQAEKAAQGVIELRASQEGDHILIEIEDDGKGMDVDRIRQKAIERGLVSEIEVNRMDEKHVLDFIFMAGFSTARQQTELSGRGVGMDVVKTHIARLNGFVEASTAEGKGSKIKITLPLTLAIVQALMVAVGDEIFAVPLSPVSETIKIKRSDTKTIDGRPVITMRGRVIPVVDLADVYDIPGRSNQAKDTDDVFLVIVSLGERKFAILVDRLLGKEEIVIKNMSGMNAEREGIAGATIRGDGKVVLIVDLTVLLRELMQAAMA